jgi:hypothetical protein
VGRFDDGKSFSAKVIGKKFADVFFIFHDEDGGF